MPRLINFGPKKLSIKPTASMPQSNRPKAENNFPLKKSRAMAGSKTSEVPRLGIRAAMAATVPQRMALGTPKIVKPIEDKTP